MLSPHNEKDLKDVILEKDGDSIVVNLMHEDPDIFARFTSWLYRSEFLSPDETKDDVSWAHLIGVYLFAVSKGIPQLQNACIDLTIRKTKDGGMFPDEDIVNSLYRVDVKAGLLRNLLVVLFATCCELKSTILHNRGYHHTFLNWLVIELYEMRKKKSGTKGQDVWRMRAKYYAPDPENPIAVD